MYHPQPELRLQVVSHRQQDMCHLVVYHQVSYRLIHHQLDRQLPLLQLGRLHETHHLLRHKYHLLAHRGRALHLQTFRRLDCQPLRLPLEQVLLPHLSGALRRNALQALLACFPTGHPLEYALEDHLAWHHRRDHVLVPHHLANLLPHKHLLLLHNKYHKL